MMRVNIKIVNKEMVERYLKELEGTILNDEGKVITGQDSTVSACLEGFDVEQDPQITFECYKLDENEDHFYITTSDKKEVVFDKEDIKQMDVEYTNKKYPRLLRK